MKVTLFDLQDERNPLNGCAFERETSLLAALDSLRSRPPFFAELVGDNGDKLLIGIGDVGCVQHSDGDGHPPYLMAVSQASQDIVEYLISDTPSPVPGRYCLPFEAVREIASHFQRTGERSPLVSWEEI